ncbi:MAG: hypothetical protein LBP50_01415 [Tannerella sp.]|jgi:hypothetical protein|nr:hypothetical protein [Tannerella sp.]
MKSMIQYFGPTAPRTHGANEAACQLTNLSGTPCRRLRKRFRAFGVLMAVIALICFGSPAARAQGTLAEPIAVNTFGGEYVIPATPINVTYYFTGTSTATNRIRVTQGFKGAIYLKGVSITTTGTNEPPIRIEGVNGSTWWSYSGGNNDHVVAHPVTNVDIILDGINFLQNTAQTCAVLQVDLGAQINIRAKDEQPLVRPTAAVNASGSLVVRKTSDAYVTYTEATRDFTGNPTGSNTGAAIGGPAVAQGLTNLYNKSNPEVSTGTGPSTGGNVIITSGTIVAIGGEHAAGIGGPHWSYYNGIIMIYGGIVSAISGSHGAGIGSGCPTGNGVIATVGGASMIIAIPPASVRAFTRQGGGPPNYFGLAGARDIAYIGDPEAASHFTVYTEDFKETTMYLDLSQNPRIKNTIDTLAPQFNPARLYLGETNLYGPMTRAIGNPTYYPYALIEGRYRLDGNLLWTYPSPHNTAEFDFTGKYILQNAAVFNTAVTFFTDQTNPKGYQYTPEKRTFSSGTTFSQTMVKLLAPTFKPVLECTPASVLPGDTSALIYGYDDTEALYKASMLRIGNDGNQPLLNLTFQLKADAFTDIAGNPLANAINAALGPHLKDTTVDGVNMKYLPPNTFVNVPTKLKLGLEPGVYEGQVMFDALDIPAGSLAPVPFTAEVVRYYLDPPVLTTDPPGMAVFNGSPFTVVVTFNKPVRWLKESDFLLYNGRLVPGSLDSTSIPVYFAPDLRPYYTEWTLTVDTVGESPETGSLISITARDNIGYEQHEVRTNDFSNTLKLALNTETPFATFHFDYDLPTDSVFLTAQDTLTFTLTANGAGAAVDSVRFGADYETGLDVQDPAHLATLKDLIQIRKDGLVVLPTNWEIESVNGNNTFKIQTVAPYKFEEGDYKVFLQGNLPGDIYNNAGNVMQDTVGVFKVRIPELSNCDATIDNAGFGFTPAPDSLDFLGGEVELILVGRNLQYAAGAHALQIKLPYELGDTEVEPVASEDGDSAVYKLRIPGNSTAADISHDFVALMFGGPANTDAAALALCPLTRPAGTARVTVKQAPAVKITDPEFPDPSEVTVENPWTQCCGEKRFTVEVPLTGFDRVVTIKYLGLAEEYLYSWGGGRPTSVTLPADESYLELFFITARVPDYLEGQRGAIVISTPALPSDTSKYFTFWNSPDLSEMVYIPRTTMYAGLLNLNIRGGSPDLKRSFNEGATWESAWTPVSWLEMERLDHEILFREPGGCADYIIDRLEDDGAEVPNREVELPDYAFTVTSPGSGVHHVKSGRNFEFTITLTGPYAEYTPEVSTTRQLSPDEVFVTREESGLFRVRIPAVREDIRVIIRVNGEELSGVDNAYVERTRVWTTKGGNLYIHSTVTDEAQIYSSTGALVGQVPVAAGQTVRTTLPAGFYFIKLDGKTYKTGVQ